MSGKLRATFAALLLAALAFAIGLSASPQLHAWLHGTGDWSHHECAATLLSSSSVEHSDCEPVASEPRRVPSGPIFRAPGFPPVCASLPFSLLEHAPPAQS